MIAANNSNNVPGVAQIVIKHIAEILFRSWNKSSIVTLEEGLCVASMPNLDATNFKPLEKILQSAEEEKQRIECVENYQRKGFVADDDTSVQDLAYVESHLSGESSTSYEG